jgi:hypothetical protein
LLFKAKEFPYPAENDFHPSRLNNIGNCAGKLSSVSKEICPYFKF